MRTSRSVCLVTFNRQRAHIVVDHYMQSGKVLSPEEARQRESVLHFGGSDVPSVTIVLGAKVTELAVGVTPPLFLLFGRDTVLDSCQVCTRAHGSQKGGESLVPDVATTCVTEPRRQASGDMVASVTRASKAQYVVCESRGKGFMSSGRRILVGLGSHATQADVLRAYIDASVLARGSRPDAALAVLWEQVGRAGWATEVCHMSPTNVRLKWATE